MYDEPVAVVVQKPEKVKEWEESEVKDITKDKQVHNANLRRIFDQYHIRGFERITHILVDTFEPTVENGLLTPAMKHQYEALRKKYEPALLELYLAAKQPK